MNRMPRPGRKLALSGALAWSTLITPVMAEVPQFAIDPGWPSLPAEWVLGEVTSVAIDSDDRVWILHRPASIPAEQADQGPPPVIEIDQAGNVLRSWGGPGEGYDWPQREHAIWVDAAGYIWISGNGGWPESTPGVADDDMMLKFTPDGELVLQIGRAGASAGDADTRNLHQPGDQFVDENTGELYVADGYGNHRVAVYDAETGAFKRAWGGNGKPAVGNDDPFELVHAVKVSNDGIVYVADRGHQRVQWFTRAGELLGQFVMAGEAVPTPAGFAFSTDPEQQYLYLVESANAVVMIYERETMSLVGQFGSRTAAPGGMDYAHHIAVDSQGNLYTAEIVNNRRVQRFLLQR